MIESVLPFVAVLSQAACVPLKHYPQNHQSLRLEDPHFDIDKQAML